MTTEFDGNLVRLTERLRRHPEEVRELRVLHLVQTMIEKWNAQEDPVESSDEVPATAWIVRRKIEMVLPVPSVPEPGPDDTPQEKEPVDATWVASASSHLQYLQHIAGRHHRRQISNWPKPLRPVRGRDIQSLPLAWPHLKLRKGPSPTKVFREADPLPARIERWRQWLAHGHRVQFPDPGLSRQEVVAMFIALILLWSRDEVFVDQRAVYAPLEVNGHVNGGD